MHGDKSGIEEGIKVIDGELSKDEAKKECMAVMKADKMAKKGVMTNIA